MSNRSVKIRNLVKTYLDDRDKPTFTAVRNIDLDINDGEFMVLVGPLGCGKSTILRSGISSWQSVSDDLMDMQVSLLRQAAQILGSQSQDESSWQPWSLNAPSL